MVQVVQDGVPLHCAAYGSTMYDDPGSQPVTFDTIYDIASLTKMFTAMAALQLCDTGRLALDAPAAYYLPELQATSVTVRHLLTHTSGLEVRMSSLRDLAPAAIQAAVYAVQPTHPPGTHPAYVNINTLLLGDIVERVTGGGLDAVFQTSIVDPLEMYETLFCPPPVLHSRIAPTEWDDWRGGLVHGVVHDESAYALGGITGHAGLFSTAADMGRFVQCWLAGGVYRNRRLLRAETVAAATSFQGPYLRLAADPPPLYSGLGWMLNRENYMGTAPAGTYGHTGFTGPVLVVVPHHRLAVIILSNRTYPRRGERTHLPVTAAVVAAALA